jgi:hypothetical protein
MWAAVTRQRTNMPGSTLFTDSTRSSVRPSQESRGAGAMSTTWNSSSRKRRDWICKHFRGVCCIGIGIARYALFCRVPLTRPLLPAEVQLLCEKRVCGEIQKSCCNRCGWRIPNYSDSWRLSPDHYKWTNEIRWAEKMDKKTISNRGVLCEDLKPLAYEAR